MNLVEQKLQLVNEQLKKIEQIINDDTPVKPDLPFKVGVDLGTSDIVVIVLDSKENVAAAFLEWADVVKDGVVLDYWKAVQIVKSLIKKVEAKCNIEIESVTTSYPPGTDPYISINVIKAAGLEVDAVIDEPSSFAELLNLDSGAVVDIGGGTTGISVVQDRKIIYSGDEPTGGRHLTLTIAGNQNISYEKAELLKRSEKNEDLISIVIPVFQKMTDIVQGHIQNYKVDRIFLTGGTCCFPGIDKVFKDVFPDKEVILPVNPLYSTPLSIASYKNNKSNEN